VGRSKSIYAIAVAILISVAAACGTSTPTPAPTPTPAAPTASPSPVITPQPTPTPNTATPLPSIVAVPSSQFVAHAAPKVTLDAKKATALQSALASRQVTQKYPGVSAAIVFSDGTVWAGQSGSAVLSPKTAVTSDTLFSIGSISKTFVASLVGRLAQRGTISLDDLLSKYVPTFPNAAKITLRQLLNHTSGIEDLFDIKSISAAILAKPAQIWTASQVLALVGGSRYGFAPGAGYHYSNTNYILLGAAIEKATGKTVAELVRSEFLTPLGLGHTYLQTQEQAQDPLSHGYMTPGSVRSNVAGPMLPFTALATAVGPAGAYVSTAADVARWGHALYSGQVLDQATLASMVDISATQPYKPKWVYGLGMEETAINGQLAWGHRGQLDGYWSAVWYLPAYDMSIAVLTNCQWADPVAFVAALETIAIA